MNNRFLFISCLFLNGASTTLFAEQPLTVKFGELKQPSEWQPHWDSEAVMVVAVPLSMSKRALKAVVRINEIASAEEQIELWKLISNSVWQSLQQQQQQVQQQRNAAATAARKSAPKASKNTFSPPLPNTVRR